MVSIERIPGVETSSSVDAIWQVTCWNSCCSSTGVSIKFQNSNREAPKSCSCECKWASQSLHIKRKCASKVLICLQVQFGKDRKHFTLVRRTPFSSRREWMVCARRSSVALLMLLVCPGVESTKLGWTSARIWRRSIPRTAQSSCTTFTYSKTLCKRSFCKESIPTWQRIIHHKSPCNLLTCKSHWMFISQNEGLPTLSLWSFWSWALYSSSLLNVRSWSPPLG